MSEPPSFAYREARFGGAVQASVERRADGSCILRSTEALEAPPLRLTDRLEHWAGVAPDRCFIAKRGPDGAWQRISYAQMLQRARRLGQALLDLGARGQPLSADRPLLILSGNDLEHASLAMAAMWIGVPHAPVSTAYSLVSTDFGKLRHIVATLTPGLVYASGAEYAKAIDAVIPADVELVVADAPWHGRSARRLADLLATEPGPEVDRAHAATGPETIAKFLFTSGSTKLPKAVPNTQRMLASNQQMIRQCMAFLADEPPVLVDWLPWNHTFGANHNFGMALYNGGSFYIDDGRPTPSGIGETLRNLREIAPTIYLNVPKGFEEIAVAMESDPVLRESIFSRLRAFMYAGAGLSPAVWERLHREGERTIGRRVRMLTSLGMTETAPLCTFEFGSDAKAGLIGLPAPGVEVKLIPLGVDKTEIRFRGPNVMPGYWRAPAETAEAFDEEGFYRTGDAVRFVDDADPSRGLRFDGRLAEDFKLSTGTFVSVGPLRARVIAAGAPLVADVVVTGLNRDDLGVLILPRVDACRALAGRPDADLAEAIDSAPVREFFQALVDRLDREGTGSANRVARLQVLLEPPSLDAGEITDKGSLNQRAVLSRRSALVDALYDGTDPRTIWPSRRAVGAADRRD